MTTVKTKIAETLFSTLSAFHDVSGLILRAVTVGRSGDSLARITFDFGTRALVLRADEEDDTVEFWSTESTLLEPSEKNDDRDVYLWKQSIGQEFGWGWVTVNQQGYLDGVMLSFGGITPQFLITAAASCLKVSHIGKSDQTPM
jgi:hypothetical protein